VGVLPWMRDALPLLFAQDELIAVGDLWLETRWCAADAVGFAPAWLESPIIS
jgi:TilS substrate C-terminal domain